jgi:Xaa-Pro dipeptidase
LTPDLWRLTIRTNLEASPLMSDSLESPAGVSLTGRRRFVGLLGGVVGVAAVAPPARLIGAERTPPDPCSLPRAIRSLAPMTSGVVPIAASERQDRIERARRLMTDHELDAILLEPGTSLSYFTGVSWGLSERPFLVIMPARGDPAVICPAFEEARARERVSQPAEVRVWQEDESPYALVAGVLRDRRVVSGRVGMESQVRFFVADGVRSAGAAAAYVSADPVTVGCRMIKTAAELALMQRASDITIAAFKACFASMVPGMTAQELSSSMLAAQERLGGSDPWALVGFGKASAFPHGSTQPQHLREGDIVLMDAGCAVEGYQSDITRTTVFGKPTARQTEIWNLERRAQDAALAAARVGATCQSVDAAARKVITDAGFGPGYQVPGLPHRTGHGIGMDGHESPNFVRGNTTILEPGMCFSDEPTIVIYGEFGIRLEDCLHITPDGARLFTEQSPAIDHPFA